MDALDSVKKTKEIARFLVIIQDFTDLMKITFMWSFGNVKIKVMESGFI